MSTPTQAIRITCPICKVRLPADGTVCPDCGQDLAVLVRETRRVDILFNEGLAAAKAGDAATSIRRLEDALTLAPQRIDVLDLLARLYLRSGLRSDALAAWKRLLQIAPDNAAAKQAVQDLEAALGRAQKDALTRTRKDQRRRRRDMIMVAAGTSLAVGALVASAVALLRPTAPPAAQPAAAMAPPTATTTPSPTSPPPSPTAIPPTATALPTVTPLPTATTPPTATPFPDYTMKVRDVLAAFAINSLDVAQDGEYVIVRGEVASLADKDNAESAARAAYPKLVSDLLIAKTYEVQPGDTFYKIARRVNRDAKAIAATNKMRLDAVLPVGKRLLIP
jgi:LysM repeat protein